MANNFKNLYLFGGFSDYFNRIIKRFNTLNEYLTACPTNYKALQDFNFNPNDDVNATHVINFSESWTPNYMLVVEPSNSTIESRWFVVETKRTRGKQYQLTLKRDVVADWYSDIIKAPTFIEKATLNNDDPFIFNSENLDLNRIKKSETLLKDETGIGWIVGYVSRGQNYNISEDITTNIDIDFKSLTAFNSAYGTTITSVSGVHSVKSCKGSKIIFESKRSLESTEFYHRINTTSFYQITTSFEQEAAILPNIKITGELPNLSYYQQAMAIDREVSIQTMANSSDFLSELTNFYTYKNYFDNEQINKLLSANGKILELNNADLYQIRVVRNSTNENVEDIALNSSFDILLNNIVDDALYELNNEYGGTLATVGTVPYKIKTVEEEYRIIFYPLDKGKVETTIHSSRNTLMDAPYDMFCIPYGTIRIKDTNETPKTNGFYTSKEWALLAAQAIGNSGGSTWLYDMQLLPYCPIRSIANNNIDIDLINMNENTDFNFINMNVSGTETEKSIIFWAVESSGTFNINYSYAIDNNKLANETEMFRLVSPNYNGIFEFNAAKMYGITGFNVDFTYKPYNPYIHINPLFSGLYGQDFDDARGLICGGDFSVAIATDRWKEYEVNNKNYQNIFDRQITNLEFNQRQERINSYFNAFGGAVSGAASGFLIGGGPVGAIAGGALGAAGGIADLAMMQSRQQETKSYQIDMYNMQLGNIKALPYSLTKSSALTANNKIFPFLEFYECTEEEKEAVRKKLYYNGMTVGRIGTIEEFLQEDFSFIQGQLIRLEITTETHVINTIYDELRKGVYIK